jgi:hypothetical protein
MHITEPHIVREFKRKIDELYIRMRNCKTPMVVEVQPVDYAAICVEKIGPSPYPRDTCTPP